MKQSIIIRKIENLFKRVYRWHSLILVALLFVLSMSVTSVVAQVTESTIIFQSQSAPIGLVENAKKLYETGDLEGAVADLQQAADIFAASGDKLNQGMVLSNLSLIYQKLGQWKDAKQAINESLKLLETQPQTQERSRILAQTLDIQGKLQRELGQPEEALKTWQKATEIYTQIENKDGAIQSQINQVLALQDLGLYPRACNTLLAVLELDIQDCDQLSQLTQEKFTEKLQLFQDRPASQIEVQGLRNLGEVLQVLGQPIHSQIVSEASLNLAEQLDPSPDRDSEIATVHLSLGNTARVRRNFEDALQHYQQADTESAPATTKIRAQLNRLSLLVKRQSWLEVPNLASKIQSSLNDLPASRTAVENRINLAQSLICLEKEKELKEKELELSEQEREGSSPILQQCILAEEEEKSIEENALPVSEVPNWEEIAEIVTAAVEQAKSLGNKRVEAYALGYLGGVYQQMGNFPEAQKFTKQALELASAFDAPEIVYRWQWQLGRLRQIQEDEQGAIAAYTAAFQTLQSLRGDLVAINPEVQFTFRDSVEPVYREYVDLLLPPEKPNQDNLKRARDAIEALQLAELDDFFQDACVEAKPEQIDRVVDQATPPAAVFYTIIVENRLVVILKLPEPNKPPEEQKLLYHSTSFNRKEELTNTLEQLQGHLIRDPERVNDIKQLSGQVYCWLIKPFEEHLNNSGVKTLVFVLDDSLRNLPMAVLYDGQQYLVEKYAVALTPGLQLLSPRPWAQVQVRLNALNALTVGISEKLTVRGRPKPFAQLENVEEELKEIPPQMRRAELLNQRFTRENLQDQLESVNFSMVHIATHANFSSDPENTYILVYGSEQGRGELLKVKDLDNLFRIGDPTQSSPTELLVLSACETAKGDKRATLGLAGVAVRAGARSTLATLWQVNDESTAELMKEFYRQLKDDPKITKAKALQRAQLALWKNEDLEWFLPYFWASYVLVGNWL